jgi:hypothetical protein
MHVGSYNLACDVESAGKLAILVSISDNLIDLYIGVLSLPSCKSVNTAIGEGCEYRRSRALLVPVHLCFSSRSIRRGK